MNKIDRESWLKEYDSVLGCLEMEKMKESTELKGYDPVRRFLEMEKMKESTEKYNTACRMNDLRNIGQIRHTYNQRVNGDEVTFTIYHEDYALYVLDPDRICNAVMLRLEIKKGDYKKSFCHKIPLYRLSKDWNDRFDREMSRLYTLFLCDRIINKDIDIDVRQLRSLFVSVLKINKRWWVGRPPRNKSEAIDWLYYYETDHLRERQYKLVLP